MSFSNPDRHWMQLHHTSYPSLEQLVELHCNETTAELRGPKGTTWKLDPATEFRVLADDCVIAAGFCLTAQVDHLPTHAYRALVQASPSFHQYRHLSELYGVVRVCPPDWRPTAFARQLEQTVETGRQPDTQPALVLTPQTYNAVWRPNEIYFRRTEAGHWFMALCFTPSFTPIRRATQRVTVGLDLGLSPRTVAHCSDGRIKFFYPTSLDHLEELPPLSIAAQLLLTQLVYASGRQDMEKLIPWLNFYADAVFAERLSLHGMSKNFVYGGRDLAIHDHHFSALSQYLYASQVPFRRVPAAYTSKICSACLADGRGKILGDRHIHHFTCPRCGIHTDAHANAAYNVYLLGQALPPRHYGRVS